MQGQEIEAAAGANGNILYLDVLLIVDGQGSGALDSGTMLAMALEEADWADLGEGSDGATVKIRTFGARSLHSVTELVKGRNYALAVVALKAESHASYAEDLSYLQILHCLKPKLPIIAISAARSLSQGREISPSLTPIVKAQLSAPCDPHELVRVARQLLRGYRPGSYSLRKVRNWREWWRWVRTGWRGWRQARQLRLYDRMNEESRLALNAYYQGILSGRLAVGTALNLWDKLEYLEGVRLELDCGSIRVDLLELSSSYAYVRHSVISAVKNRRQEHVGSRQGAEMSVNRFAKFYKKVRQGLFNKDEVCLAPRLFAWLVKHGEVRHGRAGDRLPRREDRSNASNTLRNRIAELDVCEENRLRQMSGKIWPWGERHHFEEKSHLMRLSS